MEKTGTKYDKTEPIPVIKRELVGIMNVHGADSRPSTYRLCFIFTAIGLLAIGCAAPMTEVVATRQSGRIDQGLFREGDRVWITYQDQNIRKTKSGRVLHLA